MGCWWTLPLRRLLLSLGIKSINPAVITRKKSQKSLNCFQPFLEVLSSFADNFVSICHWEVTAQTLQQSVSRSLRQIQTFDTSYTQYCVCPEGCAYILQEHIAKSSNIFRHYAGCIEFFLSVHEGRGLWLKSLLDILPPFVCGILRSGPSSSQMNSQWSSFIPLEHCLPQRAGGGEMESWSPTLPMPSSLKSVFFLLIGGLLLLLLLVLRVLSAQCVTSTLPTAMLKNVRRTTPEDATHREMLNIVFNSRLWPSSLENKILHYS